MSAFVDDDKKPSTDAASVATVDIVIVEGIEEPRERVQSNDGTSKGSPTASGETNTLSSLLGKKIQLEFGCSTEALVQRVVPLAYVGCMTTFLRILGESEETNDERTIYSLTNRIVSMFKILSDPEGSHVEILTEVEDSLDSCHDKPILALNRIGTLVRIVEARGDPSKLRELGKRIMRLEIVHKYAALDIKERLADEIYDDDMVHETDVDEVSVYLTFETLLRPELDLPIDAEAISYMDTECILGSNLEKARVECLAVQDVAFENWLTSWSEWQREQRRSFAEQNLAWNLLPVTKDAWKYDTSQSTDLVGYLLEPDDTIVFRRSVLSLEDFIAHWVPTGRDFANIPVSVDDVKEHLFRLKT
uniref:NEL domain-containing protein n=1 Tax=Mucochytrium quahogii TaxID=96639 RepID=A0A7S2RJX0_9STRA|mmetsp:Transcript_4022/g.5869  ORF Transcript_4022/g.5869 Transcript_4022/m.5869 type:complete len:362 (+) Transcript_4022:608-1693(+)|eukprot:CAMPEP_0203773194 /NCGR_PEP_ID=MMETSP0099_2-20121227/4514_1 /ASSEMBLY_ACC=CAM_ASM_000209 /TAXON_ID=96639 /ORGANISM=" , Strain NY0313808BC1" /LENGTH=361 /DNA_ID=CAMNT_0050670981 /DNA_START=522 /DNA_END=1607 /DNA_ORIENTATION=-